MPRSRSPPRKRDRHEDDHKRRRSRSRSRERRDKDSRSRHGDARGDRDRDREDVRDRDTRDRQRSPPRKDRDRDRDTRDRQRSPPRRDRDNGRDDDRGRASDYGGRDADRGRSADHGGRRGGSTPRERDNDRMPPPPPPPPPQGGYDEGPRIYEGADGAIVTYDAYDPFAAAPKGKKKKKAKQQYDEPNPEDLAQALEEELTGPDAEELAMMAAMGIPTGFNTTQGKEVDDPNCNLSAIHKKSTRQARQYMNRRGGFNRPLPAEVTGQKVNTD
eukprot:501565-Prorocentrum_minimum.AAC.3